MSLHRNYSFVLTWPPHYRNKPSPSHLPSRPFCCLWHHRSLNSPSSSLILVRYCRLGRYMVQSLLNISLFLCSCLCFRITSLSPFLWRTPRLCPWPYPFQHVHHTSQHSHSHLIPVIKSSPLCWWTQIFISFSPNTFTTVITQLQDTISDISSWMITSVSSLIQVSLFLSSACNYHIRDLRRIRHTLDLKTASVIATSLVHSKLHYCNLFYLNLPQQQISRLQLLQNSLARAVTRTPKLNISPRYSNHCTGSK